MDMVVVKIFTESMNSYICSTFLLSCFVLFFYFWWVPPQKSKVNVVLWMLISCAWPGSTEVFIIFYCNIEVQEGSIYYFKTILNYAESPHMGGTLNFHI